MSTAREMPWTPLRKTHSIVFYHGCNSAWIKAVRNEEVEEKVYAHWEKTLYHMGCWGSPIPCFLTLQFLFIAIFTVVLEHTIRWTQSLLVNCLRERPFPCKEPAVRSWKHTAAGSWREGCNRILGEVHSTAGAETARPQEDLSAESALHLPNTGLPAISHLSGRTQMTIGLPGPNC